MLAGCGLPTSRAHGPAKTWHLGFLSPIVRQPFYDGFTEGLRELGYVEGQNVTIKYRYAEGRFDRLPEMAAKLVGLGVNVLVPTGNLAIQAAQHATRTIPIVMGLSTDPVGSGLVASLARPGGNVTGVSQLSHLLTSKRLDLLKEVVPGASRIGVFSNAASPGNRLQWEVAERDARARGFQVQMFEIRESGDFAPAFEAASRAQVDALLMLDDSIFAANRMEMIDLCIRYRLPAMHASRVDPLAGGLMAYAPDLAELFRRASGYVDRIQKGANPAELPVEQPSRFDFAVNLKTARAIGVTVPDSVLRQTTEIIE